MSIISDVLGTLAGYNTGPNELGNYQILDDIFTHSAIILQDAQLVFNIPLISPLLAGSPFFGGSAPLPLVGLAYKTEGEVGLLEYEWAEYPFLSKQVITNAAIKQQPRFQVEVYSLISGVNPIALNIVKVPTIIAALDQYVAKGGLFTVLTLYGPIQDCVLEKVVGISDGNGMEGTHLRMMFKKTNISSLQNVIDQVTSFISSVNMGGAAMISGEGFRISGEGFNS